jgi:glycine cleavage system regulatory protein
MASVVLTFVAADRPGLVSRLSETVAEHGGSWLESRLAGLAGHFAGVVLVEIPADRRPGLREALSALAADGIKVTMEESEAEAAQGGVRRLKLDLVGHDRPGILRDITHALADHGVNIEELTSYVRRASFSAEVLFHAEARLEVPQALDDAALTATLESLAREMMVDITLETDG